MTNQIRLKRGSGSNPSASDLAVGELAVRTDTGVLFTKDDGGSVITLGGGGGISDGDKGDITVSNSGDTFTIDNGVVSTDKIASTAVTSAKMATNAVGAGALQENAVETAKIQNGAVTAVKIQDDLPVNKLAVNNAHIIVGDGSNDGALQTISGDATLANNGALTIANDAVTLAKMQNVITDTILGRTTNGTGNLEVLSASSVRGIINVEDGATADQTASEILSLLSDQNISTSGNITSSAGEISTTNGSIIANKGTNNQVVLGHDGAIEISRNSGGAFIDFKSTTSEDHDARIQESSGGFTMTGTLTSTFSGNLTGNVTGNASGSSGSCSGNAATATKLAATKNIAGVAFDGSANISLNNNAITNGAGYITSSGTSAGFSAGNASNLNSGTIPDARISSNILKVATGNSNLNTAQSAGVYRLNTGITNGTSGINSYGTLLNCNNGSDTGFQIYGNFNSDNYFIRGGNSSTFGGSGSNRPWAKIWNDQNDGSGSGLDADTCDGLQVNNGASNNTIVARNGDGYVFANYFNTTANDVSSGVTKVMVETGNDNYIRHGSAAAIRTFINVADGANNITNNNQLTNGAGYITSSSAGIPASGGTFTGDIGVSGGAGALTVNANSDIRLTNGSWTGNAYGKIQHHGNALYIGGGSNSSTSIIFRYDSGDKIYMNSNGTFYPTHNNSADLGTSGNRWRNLYVQDMHLSNGKDNPNKVDGTWGDWTLQEGEDQIYMLNNRNGKKYSMNLTEIV